MISKTSEMSDFLEKSALSQFKESERFNHSKLRKYPRNQCVNAKVAFKVAFTCTCLKS